MEIKNEYFNVLDQNAMCRIWMCTAQEYTDAMTLSGTKVEGFEKLDADLEKIVIGQIEKIEKHPDADKLIICQVNVGS